MTAKRTFYGVAVTHGNGSEYLLRTAGLSFYRQRAVRFRQEFTEIGFKCRVVRVKTDYEVIDGLRHKRKA
jgi:hypothetical protein